jgi:hypothetical protein
MSEAPIPSSKRRRLFRYSLRTLLVLVTLVAVTIAFRAAQVARQRRAVSALASSGGMVGYFDEGWGPLGGYGRVPPDDTGTGWLREFFALRYPGEAYLKGADVSDQTIRDYVLPLSSLAWLGFTETSVSHEGLAQLAAMPELRMVTLRSDARHDRLVFELGEPTIIEFQEVPLQDGIDYLVDLHDIPIEIDRAVVSREHLDGRRPLTGVIQNKQLCEALTELLAPCDLGWTICNCKLMITTRSIQEEHDAMVREVKARLPQVKELVID